MGDYYQIPDEYKPITMWGYFGYSILFAIPLVGFILLLVFSLGGARNINLRNYARSYFCWVVIGIVMLLLMFLFGGTALVKEYINAISARI